MLDNPTWYKGQSIGKLSLIAKIASDTLTLIKDATEDEAIKADVIQIIQDIEGLTESLYIMEQPPLAVPPKDPEALDEAQ